VAGFCEYDDEPLGSGATELVSKVNCILTFWTALVPA
jgi:hypothetical protein